MKFLSEDFNIIQNPDKYLEDEKLLHNSTLHIKNVNWIDNLQYLP